MIHAFALLTLLTQAQAPQYTLATTPPKYAAEFCRAIDILAGMNVFYKSRRMILAVEADDAGTFRLGLEVGEGKDMYLVPLVAGTSKGATLQRSRAELRKLMGTTERFLDGQWIYVKAALRVVPGLTKRIRIWAPENSTEEDGSSEPQVLIDPEHESGYCVVFKHQRPARLLGFCLGSAPFAKPRSHAL